MVFRSEGGRKGPRPESNLSDAARNRVNLDNWTDKVQIMTTYCYKLLKQDKLKRNMHGTLCIKKARDKNYKQVLKKSFMDSHKLEWKELQCRI